MFALPLDLVLDRDVCFARLPVLRVAFVPVVTFRRDREPLRPPLPEPVAELEGVAAVRLSAIMFYVPQVIVLDSGWV